MKNTLMVDWEKQQLVMDKTFARNCKNTMSKEYAHLQNVKRDNPTFVVIIREIKKNNKKETYKGLTYEYMEAYIKTHETGDALENTLAEFMEKKLLANCHSVGKRYPVIKKWFLEKYPAVADYGMEKDDNAGTSNTNTNAKVLDFPQTNEAEPQKKAVNE